MKFTVKFNQNSVISFLIFEITVTAVKFYIVQAVPGLYVYNSIANLIISCFLLPFLIPALGTAFFQKRNFLLISFFIFSSVICFQIAVFPENAETILSGLVKIMGMSFGCLIAAYTLTDYELFYHKLVNASHLIICCALIQYVAFEFFGVVGTEQLDYNMSFGFFLVIPTIMEFLEIWAEKKKRWINLFFFVLSSVMIVTMGSRGAVLAVFIGCVLGFYSKTKLRRALDFFLACVSSMAGVFLLFHYQSIAKFFYDFLVKYNIKSRMLAMLAYGDITWSAGRDILQEKVGKMIAKHPLIGNGMLSDNSSHNIFYEVILFYGYPVGILLILFLLAEWMKILYSEDEYKRKLMIVFGSYAIVDSLLNLTVLGKDMFWIYLGLALSTKLMKKNRGNVE